MAVMTINANDLVQIRNTRDWALSFQSAQPPYGGIIIPPRALMRLPYIEVETQAHTPGSFFYGESGDGVRAAIEIVDAEVRKQVFGGTEQPAKQEVLDLETVKALLKINPLSAFEKKLKETIKTDSEKRMIARMAVDAGLNEVVGGAGKKRVLEKHIGYAIVEAENKDVEHQIVMHDPEI